MREIRISNETTTERRVAIVQIGYSLLLFFQMVGYYLSHRPRKQLGATTDLVCDFMQFTGENSSLLFKRYCLTSAIMNGLD